MMNHNTRGSICSNLESRKVSDDDLPSVTAIVEQLVECGANPDKTNGRGERLLHLAVALGHEAHQFSDLNVVRGDRSADNDPGGDGELSHSRRPILGSTRTIQRPVLLVWGVSV